MYSEQHKKAKKKPTQAVSIMENSRVKLPCKCFSLTHMHGSFTLTRILFCLLDELGKSVLILNGLATKVFLGDFPDLQIMNKHNKKWSRESL